MALNQDVVGLAPLNLTEGNRVIPEFQADGTIFPASVGPFDFNGPGK